MSREHPESTLPVPWPDGGPWVLATTAADVDWRPAAAALAAASTVRVAALVFGAQEPPGGLLLGELATFLQAGDSAADPLSVDEAVALVRTLARTHGLVLVVGVPGLMVPAGRAGWTLMDLAVAVSAPVVVVTGTGPDAANHTTLALGAVAGHGLTAAVVTVGGPPAAPDGTSTVGAPVVARPAPGADDGVVAPAAPGAAGVDETAALAAAEHSADKDAGEGDRDARAGSPAPAREGDARSVPDLEAGIPVAPAGRIPADAGERPEEFAAAAKGWLHPLLHASAGRPKAEVPPPPPQPLPPPATASGKRVVLLLAGVFVSMSLVVCGLAFCEPTVQTEAKLERITVESAPRAREPGSFVRPSPVPPKRPVGDVCPQNSGRIKPAAPDRATTKRVDAAWKRIEIWLAARAPATRRSLRPPAPAERIDAAQRRMSVAFPADLVASLRRHDGVSHRTGDPFTLPFFYTPMPVGDIPAEWLMLCGALVDVFDEQDSSWWDKAFVPFASSGDGGYLLVDQRLGSHSRVGEFYNEDGVSFQEWPASVVELLEQTADSLETGRPFGNTYRPTVTKQGTLDWDIV